MEASAALNPLLHQVHGMLDSSPYLPAQKVQIEVEEGHVRLEGTVRTYFQKQMAQELLRRLDGVETIENLLQVNWSHAIPR
jgi:osmotically-inducible protein OsmY